jgi:hypothetical protein
LRKLVRHVLCAVLSAGLRRYLLRERFFLRVQLPVVEVPTIYFSRDKWL